MPEILEFISQIKDEPVAILLFVVVLGIKFVEIFVRHVIPFLVSLITHKKKKTIEEMFAEDMVERKERQTELDSKLAEIKSDIEELYSTVADHEELLGKASQGTLENMLFNEEAPIFRRLKAFLRLLAMARNGRVKKRGIQLILESPRNKETWLDVVEMMPCMNLTIEDPDYFNAVLKEINDRVYDGMMM